MKAEKGFKATITFQNSPQGKIFFVEYRDKDGKRKRPKGHEGFCNCKKTPCHHYDSAKKVLDDLVRQAKQANGGKPLVTFETAKEQYDKVLSGDRYTPETKILYMGIMERFGEFLAIKGIRYLQEVTLDNIRDFRQWRRATGIGKYGRVGISESTANRDIRTLQAMFTLLDLPNPIKGKDSRRQLLTKATERKNMITKEEFGKLARYFLLMRLKKRGSKRGNGTNLDILIMLYFGGFRINEVLQLQWQNVKLNERIIEIRNREDWHPKMRKERDVVMAEAIFRMLQRRFKYKKSETWVFPIVSADRPYLYQCVETDFDIAFQELGIVGVNPEIPMSLHILRKTFISRCINELNIPIPIVCDMVGHSDYKTMEFYRVKDLSAAHRFIKGL